MTPSRRWQFLLLLVLTGAPLFAPVVLDTAYSGWPVVGFAVGHFLVAGRRHRLLASVTQTLVVGAAFSLNYDIPAYQGAAVSTVVTLPALLTAILLTRGQDDQVLVNLVDNVRYHVVTAVSAAASALVAGLATFLLGDPARTGIAMGITFLAILTCLLVVLPLMISTLGRPAIGLPSELWAQRIVMAVGTFAVFWPREQPLPLMFVLFPPLAWAAIRATRRETHIQLFLVCMTAYTLTFLDRGPIAQFSDSPDRPIQQVVVYVFVWAACYLIVPLTLTVEQLFAATSRADRAATTVQRLVDSATQTIFIATDEDGAITHYSFGAESALGYRAQEVMGRSPAMFHTAAEIRRHAAYYGTAPRYDAVVTAQSMKGERRDWAFRTRDGSERMISLSLSEITDETGRIIGHIGAGEDITDRLRSEQALAAALAHEQEAVTRLKEVDQVKEELLSNVSHELRTPITSIAGYTELLTDGALGELTVEQQAALERIERNSERLSMLVDDLLTMSRAESGQLLLEQEQLDLCSVAQDAFTAIEGMLASREIDLTLSLPERPAPVIGDRHALERVAVNLLSNAIKFTPDGGSVDLAVELSNGHAALVATDTGIGISPKDQKMLFTRFFRATDATERAIQGTGLGLSIVQALVTQHGGTIGVESEPSRGTRVTARFPVAS